MFLYYNGQSAELQKKTKERWLPWVVAAVVVGASRSPDHCHSCNDWGNRQWTKEYDDGRWRYDDGNLGDGKMADGAHEGGYCGLCGGSSDGGSSGGCGSFGSKFIDGSQCV